MILTTLTKIKKNIYIFNWKGRRVAMRSIPSIPKELKETKQRSSSVVKEEINLSSEVSEQVEQLLEESKGVFHNELLERLPPMRGIQHYIDFIPRASVPNLSHYRMNPKKSKVPKKRLFSLLKFSRG